MKDVFGRQLSKGDKVLLFDTSAPFDCSLYPKSEIVGRLKPKMFTSDAINPPFDAHRISARTGKVIRKSSRGIRVSFIDHTSIEIPNREKNGKIAVFKCDTDNVEDIIAVGAESLACDKISTNTYQSSGGRSIAEILPGDVYLNRDRFHSGIFCIDFHMTDNKPRFFDKSQEGCKIRNWHYIPKWIRSSYHECVMNLSHNYSRAASIPHPKDLLVERYRGNIHYVVNLKDFVASEFIDPYTVEAKMLGSVDV